MKVRKEFIIFGGIIVVLIVLICISSFSNKNKGYKSAQKYISYEEIERTEEYYDEEVSDVEEVIQEAEEEKVAEEVVDTAEPIIDAEISTEQETIYSDETEQSTEEANESSSDMLVSDSISDTVISELDSDTVISLVRYYVCNLTSESFEMYLTEDLINNRESLLSTEPYISLNGETSIDSAEFIDNKVNFKFNGVDYIFEVAFTEDGTRISSINFVE